MHIHEQLMSKNGLTISILSREFLASNLNDRVPTVSEFSERLGVARGTVHNALKGLEQSGIIELENRGRMGSYLTHKDDCQLLKNAGITSLVGAMPLPYSKRFEGMATGIVSSSENKYDLPISLYYMRGSKRRVSMVLEGRCDFAILSKYAAQTLAKEDPRIQIALEFGPGSYSKSYVVLFHDDQTKEIKDGMRMGIDKDSVEQEDMTKVVCRDKKVKLIPVKYSSLLREVINGELDAAVWNLDEVIDSHTHVNYQTNILIDTCTTNAAIVTTSERPEMGNIIRNCVDTKSVLKAEKDVISGKLIPSY